MTIPPPAHDLDALRRRLGPAQRAFASALWAFYRDHTQWVPSRIVHQHFGRAAAESHLAELGSSLVAVQRDQGKPYYRLTFLGVLLTDQGAEAEGLLTRYLEYVRDRYRSDPGVEWVGSQEVEAALRLSVDQSRLLRQLVRLSHWWGGGSAFGEREWTVGVPVDVDDLAAEADVRRYVREHVLKHFPLEARRAAAQKPGGTPGGAFWFVEDAALRERLAAAWHEAQDVFHVLAWKSCVILCGGILEALLSRALARKGSAAGRARPSLATLVTAATRRRLVKKDSLQLSPALQAFPALIHPGRQPSTPVVLGRAEADAALAAVRSCLKQIAPARPKSSRPAAR